MGAERSEAKEDLADRNSHETRCPSCEEVVIAIEGSKTRHGLKLLIQVRVPLGAMPDECRSCHAKVFWGKTPSRKKMIIDADPVSHDRANVLIVRGTESPNAAALRGELFVAHWATCPQAKDWKAK